MESCGILGSPKTPVKKVTSKTRAASKDLVCLLCGMSLVGERCTFNVENHGLQDKMQSILEEKIDLSVQSCRVCRPCGRQTEALDKRFSVIRQQIGEFRSKYSLSCRKTISVKRLPKSSPSPKAHKKIRSGRLSLSSVCEGSDKDFTDSFQPLPDTVDNAERNSSKPMEVVEPVPQKPLPLPSSKDPRNNASEIVPVQV